MHYKYDAVTRKMMRKATDADTQLQMLKEVEYSRAQFISLQLSRVEYSTFHYS